MGLKLNSQDTLLSRNIKVEDKVEEKNIENRKNIIYIIIKRLVDILSGIIGIVLLLPITIGLYIMRIFLRENKGPLFYDQLRMGKNGREFKLYKYRSMVMNADEELWKYLEENKEAYEEYKQYKKLKEDPRITKLGKFLRKTSLDEFPQFINILKGEMSLVGPRPYLHREKEDMGSKYHQIVKIKPGLTGYWQVNGRSDVDFDERLNMDIIYIENRTLWLDFKIIIKTILRVFKKRGAM